jgi:hypothetical protein
MQALVTQYADMVTALSASADAAANKFSQQQAAAASLSASMRDSITSMKEAAALAQQLTDKYVEQMLMLDAATGGFIEDWNCSRTSNWEVAFAVERCVGLAATAATSPCLCSCLTTYHSRGDSHNVGSGSWV